MLYPGEGWPAVLKVRYARTVAAAWKARLPEESVHGHSGQDLFEPDSFRDGSASA